MTKKRSTKSQGRSLVGTLVGLVVVVLAIIFSNVTGINILGTGATSTPAVIVTSAAPPVSSGSVTTIPIGQGFGAQKGFWQVYFTAPTGSRNNADYVNGIDGALATAINAATTTLDIAAFEFNNPVLTSAVINAKNRGVRVRMVTDNEHGVQDIDTTITDFIDEGIPVVDDGRTALMHNKFMIIDSLTVWTGAWNYTINGTYRNNNNALALRSQRIVADYQAEFDEMFVNKQFGPRSPRNTPNPSFSQDDTPIEVYFAAEDDVTGAIINQINQAQRSVRFMAFSFTLDTVAAAVESRGAAGVTVQGVFETTGSETQFAELRPLFCAGYDVRQDGNPFVMHHKVFIIDDTTVITGSFNFSASAADSNDENIVIVRDPDLAAQYVAEFNRRFAEASRPSLTCT